MTCRQILSKKCLAAFDKLQPRACRGESIDPESFVRTIRVERLKAEQLTTEELVVGLNRSSDGLIPRLSARCIQKFILNMVLITQYLDTLLLNLPPLMKSN